jgi:tetratricopeptide (TPR) repeat protein
MLVVVALLAGTALATWQAVEATKARKLADDRLSEIDRERKQAQKNFESALQAVDQMLTRVAEQMGNEPQTEKLRHALSSDALKFYLGFLEEHSADPRVQFQTAMAYKKLGEMLMALDQYSPADEASSKAIRILQELTNSTPGKKEDYQHNLAGAFNQRGILLREAGRLEEAEQAARQAVAISRTQAAEFGGGYHGFVALRLSNLVMVLNERGKLAEAESANNEVLAMRPDLTTGEPVKLVWLAREAYSNRAETFRRSGRLLEAEQAYRKLVDLQEQAVAERPDSHAERYHLFVDRFNLANVLFLTGRFPEAEVSNRKALAIIEKLAADFRNTPSYRVSLVTSHVALADTLTATGRMREAEEVQKNALAINKQLVAEFTNEPIYESSLAAIHNNLAMLLATCSDPKLRDIPQAVQLAQQAVKLKPSEGGFWNTLGVCLYRTGDWNAAITALEKSMELDQGNSGFDWLFLAMAHWQFDHKEEARKWYDQAVEWMEKNKSDNGELRRFRAEAEELIKDK